LDERRDVLVDVVLQVLAELVASVQSFLHHSIVFGLELLEHFKKGRNNDFVFIQELWNYVF